MMSPRPQQEQATMSRSLVIVESPAKARTISKFLGDDYIVEASVGHIRDLPRNASEIPASQKKTAWSRLGVNVEDNFAPLYIIPAEKKAQVKKLKEALAGVDELLLATDEDREGESISWHLMEVLKPKVPVRRLVFHEITKTAIQHALDNAREIDRSLVEAQETRRILDRLYGYAVSPLLWRKIRPQLSAGRVQSVAVRLIVDRERERLVFTAAGWWSIRGSFTGDKGALDAEMVQLDGNRLASGRDFDDSGTLKRTSLTVLDESGASKVVTNLTGKSGKVVKVEERPYADKPAPPFTTSTLQQEAIRKLRWTARRTMSVAQRLYENGWITYMRTDSVTLSQEAITAARSLITEQYGAAYLPSTPRLYKQKVKNAQEAHEAIRPAGTVFRTLEEAGKLDADETKLYELIWKRTVASQMNNATGKRASVQLLIDNGLFQANGKTIEFPGFRRAYVEGSDDPDAALADRERVLPPLALGDVLTSTTLEPRGHTTQPPARLTEATLVKEMEARGIGRPSTYASIIDTILRREYVFKKGNALVPTFTAFAVTRLLEGHLGWLVDYEFTANMEKELDEIALGNDHSGACLSRFYLGETGLSASLENAVEQIDPRQICTILLGEAADGLPIEIRVGRYGPFLSSGDIKADVPDDLPPDELTLEVARALLIERQEGPRVLGEHPEDGKPIYLMKGRFGPYIQHGEVVETIIKAKTSRGKDKIQKSKPPRASLLRGMLPEELNLPVAVALLGLPRTLGSVEVKAEDGTVSTEDVTAANGRFGPYVKQNKESRSIPAEFSVLTITLEQAKQLIAIPSKRRRGVETLREMGQDATTEREVKMMAGRYGPYVTDGETNASLPKDKDHNQVNLAEAIAMIRLKETSPKRKATRKPAKKKPAAKRKPAAKKTTAKKTAAKKTTAVKDATAKPAVKKTAAKRKPAAKKTAAKKTTAKKATTRKPAAKKTTAKKTTAKKTTAKSAAPKAD
ncbi:MAG: DNA topoisomerase-1 [Myxococcota bacterium]|jgi:DNA topoisomerase-1